MVASMEIWDPDENNLISLPPIYTLEKIPISKVYVIKKEYLKSWPHLKGTELPCTRHNGPYEIGLIFRDKVPNYKVTGSIPFRDWNS